MPRDDDWEDEDDRPRRRRDRFGDDDDDDYSRGRRRRYAGERSGAVTAIAVISFVMGGLVLLFGICALIGLLAMTGEMGRFGGGGGMMALPGIGGGIAVAYIVVLAVLLWGIGAIFAGVGIVNRAQWGRVLCLVLGGFAAVVGVLYMFGAISILSAPQMGPMDGRGLAFMISLFIGLLFLGYCIWSFAVLLNSRYGAEFR